MNGGLIGMFRRLSRCRWVRLGKMAGAGVLEIYAYVQLAIDHSLVEGCCLVVVPLLPKT